MDNLISVIIPVYNAENYLRQCLDSVVNQTYRNLEIICVDDGSTDNSGNILDEYATKDDRFVVIHQENQGAGTAKTTGLNHVTGDYIMFVDSDDWIDLHTCEIAYQKIVETDADVVCWQYSSTDSIHFDNPIPKIEPGFYETLERKFELTFLSNCAAWCKLYKRYLIEKNNIHFKSNVYLDDNPFSFEIAWFAKRIYFINNVLYYYRKGNGVTGSKNLHRRIEVIDITTKIVDKFTKKTISSVALHELLRYKFNFIYMASRMLQSKNLILQYESKIIDSFSRQDWLEIGNSNIKIWPRARAFYQYLYQKQQGHRVRAQILKIRWFVYMVLFKLQEIFHISGN